MSESLTSKSKILLNNFQRHKRASLDIRATGQQSKSVFYTNNDDDKDENQTYMEMYEKYQTLDNDKIKKKTKKNSNIKRSNTTASSVTSKMLSNESRSIFYSNDFDNNNDAYLQHLMNKEIKNKLKSNDAEFTSFKPTIRGERLVFVLKSVKCIYSSINYNPNGKVIEHNIKGKLILTNFKLKFIPVQDDMKNYFNCFTYKSNYFKYWNEFDIPLAHIYGIYASTDKTKRLNFADTYTLFEKEPKEFIIKCKNFQTKCFAFNNENFAIDKYEDFVKLFRSLIVFSKPQIITSLCLFGLDNNTSTVYRQPHIQPHQSKKPKTYLNEVDLNDDLQNDSESILSIVRLPVVPSFDITTPVTYYERNAILRECINSSLPVVVPKYLFEIDPITKKANTADVFYENRIPIWSFTYENGSSLISVSEPLPNKQRESDEIIKKYNSLLCQWKRSKLKSKQNINTFDELDTDIDSYYKISVPFKYQKLNSSYERLLEICSYKSTNDFLQDDENWYSRLSNTKWLKYVTKLINLSTTIVDCIVEKNVNVFLEERVNKDLTCLITSLVKIMLYKKHRTIIGFQNLIQKEWFLVGHMFAKRLEILTPNKSTTQQHQRDSSNVQSTPPPDSQTTQPVETTNEYAPVFILFLDCVWQLLTQTPKQFEFNEAYLIHLFDYSISGLSVTFTFNGAHDWLRYTREFNVNTNYLNYLIDLNWNWSAHLNTPTPESGLFLNKSFELLANSYILRPCTTIYKIKFWSSCYFRWYNLTHNQIRQCENENEKLKQEQIVSVLAQQKHTSSMLYPVPAPRASKMENLRPDSYLAAFAGTIINDDDDDESENSHRKLSYRVLSRRTSDGNLESTL